MGIALRCIQPQDAGDSQALEHLLTVLLDDVYKTLRDRVAVACHGVFLDTLTANAHGSLAETATLLARSGAPHHDDDDEVVAAAVTKQVLSITKRYAQLLQPRIDDYRQ